MNRKRIDIINARLMIPKNIRNFKSPFSSLVMRHLHRYKGLNISGVGKTAIQDTQKGKGLQLSIAHKCMNGDRVSKFVVQGFLSRYYNIRHKLDDSAPLRRVSFYNHFLRRKSKEIFCSCSTKIATITSTTFAPFIINIYNRIRVRISRNIFL